jgi:hypothetical protein
MKLKSLCLLKLLLLLDIDIDSFTRAIKFDIIIKIKIKKIVNLSQLILKILKSLSRMFWFSFSSLKIYKCAIFFYTV